MKIQVNILSVATAWARRAALVLVVGMIAAAPATAQPTTFFQGAERIWAEGEVERLAAIQTAHQNAILALPGVVGMGIGLDAKSRGMNFLVLLESEDKVPDLPQQIEGIPITTQVTGPIEALHGGSGCVPCHANQQALPVPMGNSAFAQAFCSACTLGFKACYRATGAQVYVTNAHCSTDSSGCEGTAAFGSNTRHRAPLDAGCTLQADIGDVSGHVTPACGVNNTVDAARILSSDGLTSRSIRDIGTPSLSHVTAMPGDAVQKSGRTTGRTTGTVAATNVTVDVGGYCCGTARFVGQIQVNASVAPFLLGGDSGSALLNLGSPPRITGLLFAGNRFTGTPGYANPIFSVLNALNLDLDPNCQENCQGQSQPCYWNSDCCSQNCYPVPGGGGLRICI